MRPFRFAIVVDRLHDPRSWRRVCREVEDLGYSSLYLPDTNLAQMGPLVALGAAVAHTSSLRLGIFVANNELRHPAVLARELATLDVLSDGRLEWGMGAGWTFPGHGSIGLTLDRPAVKVDRLIEAVDVMQRHFSGEPVSFAGQHYSVSDLVGSPEPVQRPHPPLLVGGSERRMLMFAGAHADIVSMNRSFATASFGGRAPQKQPDEALAAQLSWVRSGAGSRFDDLELSLEVAAPVMVTTNRRAVVDRLAAAANLTADQVLSEPRNWVGSTMQIADSLRGHRERYGISHWVIHEQHLHEVAPVVAELAGR